MADRPKFENAPGINVRPRQDGSFVAFWQARADIVKRGFRPPLVPLWKGLEPSDTDREMVSDQCEMMQAEMLTWSRGGIPEIPSAFDGTVESLVSCYKFDRDSPFQKLRYGSRKNYGHFLKRIIEDHGGERVAELKSREMLRWYEDWASNGKIPMAHSLMRAWRTVLSFGLTILDDDDCARLATRLRAMRFPMGKPRESILTADQATTIRAKAHARNLPSMALAQAIQFEGMLRQRDIIGEWVPSAEPGPSFAEHAGKKWQRGVLWSEIDSNLVLSHVTSKRQKRVEIRLLGAPMVVEELKRRFPGCITEEHTHDPVTHKPKIVLIPHRELLPAFGPIVVFEPTDRPYSAVHFRELWREIATECGIPKTIRNQDSRAGAITEALRAGVPMQTVRKMATHSNESMTQRYSRGDAEEAAEGMERRASFRQNKNGT